MIEISVTIKAPIAEVWDKWISVDGVQYWAFASDDWAAEGIENDVKPGGSFKSRNYAKDGSFEFIFGGTYESVDPLNHAAYTLGDGRKVDITFNETPNGVEVIQHFEPETLNPEDKQQEGWQAYLDNFKKYVESSTKANK
ncbi:MAG: SRPBCC domain-containing protein [Candidatus Saccharimonadales bacterium]